MASPSTMSEIYQNNNNFNATTEEILHTNEEGKGLFEMGRPCILPESIDPGGRVCNMITTRMVTIDLIPCRYSINLSNISTQDMSGLKPQIEYTKAVEEFGEDCTAYGLPREFVGIRLKTTDDTTATDHMQNSRGKENFFQGLANWANDTVGMASGFFASTGIAPVGSAAVSEQIGKYAGTVAGGISSVVGPGNLAKDIAGAATTLTQSLADSAINGYRYSFPSLWSDSSYSPGITTNLKLISPYGHPDAIKKFIIEPLMYLIILASPKTKDGMAYGRPHSLTLRAYGLSYIPLAAISSISLRRGGESTAFNMYCQPTSIDVAIEFEALVGGFATHTCKFDGSSEANKDTVDNSNKFITESAGTEATRAPTLTTLEHIVESLRPMPPNVPITSHVFIGVDNEKDKSDFPPSLGKEGLGGLSSTLSDTLLNKTVSLFNTANNIPQQLPNLFNSPTTKLIYSELTASRSSGQEVIDQIIGSIKSEANAVQQYSINMQEVQEIARARLIGSINSGMYLGPTGSPGSVLPGEIPVLPRIDPLLGPILRPREIKPGSIDSFDWANDIERQIKQKVSISNDTVDYFTNKPRLDTSSIPVTLSGSMGPAVNLSGHGSDNITYVGNLMNIPMDYDKRDITKLYPIENKIEINELHEPNWGFI